MTLENLQKVGSDFTALSILLQVQDSPVSMHHRGSHVAEQGKSQDFLLRVRVEVELAKSQQAGN